MFINGKWKLSADGATREIFNPANNRIMAGLIIFQFGCQKPTALRLNYAGIFSFAEQAHTSSPKIEAPSILSAASYREFAVAFVANAVIIGLSRSRGGAVW